MSNTFKATYLAAAAMLVAGSAFAAAPKGFDQPSSSLAFVALDSTGTQTSLFVDLGYLLTDFQPGASIYQPNNTIVWNFNNNTVSVNGAPKSGTFNWTNQYSLFQAAAQAAETSYAVIGGVAEYPSRFVTTGTPTQSQFDQLTISNIGDMVIVQNLYATNGGAGNFAQPGFGANASVPGATAGYVGDPNNFGSDGNWATNLTWNALRAEGQQTNFYALNGDFGDVDPNVVNKLKLDGTFNYSAGVLTFNSPVVTAVPEPSAWLMSLAGMAVLFGVGRRRREER